MTKREWFKQLWTGPLWWKAVLAFWVLVVLGAMALLCLILSLAISIPVYGQSCVAASQVTLAGNLRAANGIPLSNGIVTLTPSQQGYIAGCGVNLQTNATCATSTDGSVVGVPNPVTATINTSGGVGLLPVGVYYTVYEWYDAAGNATLPSPETRSTVSMISALTVNSPSSGIPSNAVGMRVFIGTASGAETLQGSTTGSSAYIQSTTLAAGASPATSNSTLCSVTANDSIWPTGTGYNVSLVDASGNPIPSYPMQWQLLGAGTTINLSNGLPYYHGVVFYPVPLLAAPANHGTQSVSGGLNFGGYNVLNAGKVGVGTATPGWPLDVENGLINSFAGYLVDGNGGTNGQCLGSDGTAYDVSVPCTITGGATTIDGYGAGAGTGASASLSTGSTDTSGQLVLTSGTSPSAGANIIELSFSKAYTYAFCTVTSSSQIANSVYVSVTANPTTSANINLFTLNGVALTASTSGYSWYYHCDVR